MKTSEGFLLAAETVENGNEYRRNGLYTALDPKAPMTCDSMIDEFLRGECFPTDPSNVKSMAFLLLAAIAKDEERAK